jgi:hypothetical protein
MSDDAQKYLDGLVDAIDILYGRQPLRSDEKIELNVTTTISKKGPKLTYCCPICQFTLAAESDRCPLHQAKATIKFKGAL